jgi:hypothetical protein
MTVTSRRPRTEIASTIATLVLERCLLDEIEGVHARKSVFDRDCAVSATTLGDPIRIAVDIGSV